MPKTAQQGNAARQLIRTMTSADESRVVAERREEDVGRMGILKRRPCGLSRMGEWLVWPKRSLSSVETSVFLTGKHEIMKT
jgi:hypothetical protein